MTGAALRDILGDIAGTRNVVFYNTKSSPKMGRVRSRTSEAGKLEILHPQGVFALDSQVYSQDAISFPAILIRVRRVQVKFTHMSASHEKSPTELTLRQHPSSRSSSTFSFCVWVAVCATLACWQVSNETRSVLGLIHNGPCQVDQISSRTNKASSWHKPTRSHAQRPAGAR